MPRPRVLLVEDNDATRELLLNVLSEAGFAVVAALDGLHALRSVRAARPDAVLLDFGLPGLEGDEFVRQWRERDHDANGIPIIAMSARSGARQIAEGLGAVAFVPKPFDVDEIVRALRHALPASTPEAAASAQELRVGETGTLAAGTVRVSVNPDIERPFLLEVLRADHDAVTAELSATEFQVLRTLLDMAGRQRRSS